MLADEDISDLSGEEQDEIEEEMKEMMETIHPLRNKMLDDIFPFMKWFKNSPKKRWESVVSQVGSLSQTAQEKRSQESSLNNTQE